MRLIHGIIITPFVFVAFVVCAQTATNNWEHRIISQTRHPLASLISPHASAINVLIIDGKRFEHVRGLKKFYLQVSNINSIVFVADGDNYSVIYHIFNMDTDVDIAIHARASSFGWTIGSDYSRDTVERTDDGIIVLCNLDKGVKSTLPSLVDLDSVKELICLDPNKKAIMADKTFYYDKSGKLISEHDATPPF